MHWRASRCHIPIEDYRREVAHELFAKMSPSERLELLSDLSPREIEAYLKELRKKQPQKKNRG